jgi:hypothetical protein
MQSHGDAVGRDFDPLYQQPEDARLLGRVELDPHRLERPEGFDDLAFLSHKVISRAVLSAHRGDRPCDHLGRCEQPMHLPEDEGFDFAGCDRADRAGLAVRGGSPRGRRSSGTAGRAGACASASSPSCSACSASVP